MLRYPAEILDVLPDKLWRSMMVVENGKNSIENDVVELPYPYINGEKRMHNCEDEQMQLLV